MSAWASEHCPILYVSPDEIKYWNAHPNHRPTWFYRNVVDRKRKRICAQFIAHWPDQFDWVWSFNHRWDYEPVFLYFDYRGSSPRSARLGYIYYDDGHWKARKIHPPFLLEGDHLILLLRSKYHAYEPLDPWDTNAGKADTRGLKRYLPRRPPQPLTDAIVSSWRARPENPFTMWTDFIDPWSSGEGPGPSFD